MKDTSLIRWGVAQRFEFIEWRAYWDGRLNRGDLEQEFDISTPQASVDLRNYQDTAPGNIEYNATEKAYVATRNFRPMFLRLSAERYLLQLHSITTHALAQGETWFGELPPVDVLPTIARIPEAYTLRPIISAIRSRGELSINYQSLTSTGMRTICPHSLAHDGYRWHARAWCVEKEEYRDYVLGRILSVAEPTPYVFEPPDDVEWHTFLPLVLTPHPGLDTLQTAAIERDYRLEGGERTINMRLALAFYFVRRHNLDLRNGEIPPARAQLFLKNFDEYEDTRKSVKEQARLLAEQRRAATSTAGPS